MARPGATSLVWLAALLLVPAGAAAAGESPPGPQEQQEPPRDLAVMGTIPIYWGETGGFAEALSGGGEPHWARGLLEHSYRLQPLDYLSAAALAGHTRLLLAQPRGLSPEENVALDAWVRQGGRLLLFADPWMTGESRFALGDRRRPQAMALLSPIFAHWGLELTFDADQPPVAQLRVIGGTQVPVAMAGQFTLVGEGDECTLAAAGLAAQCALGAGSALVVADAALLDHGEPWPGAPLALDALVARSFADNGEIVHGGEQASRGAEENSGSEACPPDQPARHTGSHDPP